VNSLTRLLIAAAIMLCGIAYAVPTGNAVSEFAALQDSLRSAKRASDAGAYLEKAQALYVFLNGSPRAALQLASAQSFAGKQDAALASVAQFIAMGQSSEETLQAAQFAAMRAASGYQTVHKSMAANFASVSSAEEVFRLSPELAIPEDIDYDPNTKHFYISSVLGRRIMSVDMQGRAALFAKAPDEWPMMALKVDAAHRVLWATEVAVDGFASVAEKDWGRSAVLVFDLHSAALLQRIEGPSHTALGDMTLDNVGNAIISDGENGGVYRFSRKLQSSERIDGGDFISPQTPAFLADGVHLLVPDYVRGIGLLDLRNKHVTWLPMDGKHALSGIDGLYLLGHMLIATQNGSSPERVVRFGLDGENRAVISESIIERATASLGDPTHGVVVGKYFYYITNSGWDTLDDHGNVLAGKTLPVGAVKRAKIQEL
jgi:hypothetical protein